MGADRENPLKQSELKKVVRGKDEEGQTNTGKVWLLERMRCWIKRRKSTLLKRQKSKWKIMKNKAVKYEDKKLIKAKEKMKK